MQILTLAFRLLSCTYAFCLLLTHGSIGSSITLTAVKLFDSTVFTLFPEHVKGALRSRKQDDDINNKLVKNIYHSRYKLFMYISTAHACAMSYIERAR